MSWEVPRNLSFHPPSHLPAPPPSPTASCQLSPSSSQLLLATPPLSYLHAISQLPPARSAEPGSSTWPCRRSLSTHSTGPSREGAPSSETDRSAYCIPAAEATSNKSKPKSRMRVLCATQHKDAPPATGRRGGRVGNGVTLSIHDTAKKSEMYHCTR